ALREGQRQLRAGAVPLLRRGRPAADQQRPGAAVWETPLSRAAGQRSEGGVAGSGGARRRAVGIGGADTAGGRQGRRVGSAGRGGVAGVASGTGAPPTHPGPGPPFPTQPPGLPPRTGGEDSSVTFAVLEKNRARPVNDSAARSGIPPEATRGSK